MKAKLKKTGEIINIAEYDVVKLDKCDSYGNPIEVPYEDVEQFYDDKGVPLGMPIVFPSVIETNFSIDWEQRRYELAKEYSKEFVRLQHYKGVSETGVVSSKVSEWSVELADSLIEELKKEKQHGN